MSLYSSSPSVDPSVLEDFFRTMHVLSLDPGEAAGLEEELSVGGIASAIGSMQSSKSPGPDGYPTDFYQKFSRQLSPLLLLVFKESFSLRALPSTMRDAGISLLLKKGKNPLECGSVRFLC